MKNNFTILHDNKEFICYSEISGTSVLTQTIVVEGVGQKQDPALYGDKYHPTTTMKSAARIIAKEIIISNPIAKT